MAGALKQVNLIHKKRGHKTKVFKNWRKVSRKKVVVQIFSDNYLVIFWLFFGNYLYYSLISCHWSISIPPENRKPLVFWFFRGYGKRRFTQSELIEIWGLLIMLYYSLKEILLGLSQNFVFTVDFRGKKLCKPLLNSLNINHY